jgi:hypothetical protein
VVDLEVKEGSTPILVGARSSAVADTAELPPLPALIPRRQDCGCWASPCSGARR